MIRELDLRYFGEVVFGIDRSDQQIGDKADDKPTALPPSEEKRRILDLFRN